ncbi:MAG TPA: hypothetical protein VMF06_08050 [Candidatus Limnocylindria bacterium]|nr:hypothetical protein [Candidatus Limnocylindria bacterium]
MKKLEQRGETLVIQLSFEEWVVLSTLLRYREGEARAPGQLSKGGLGETTTEAQTILEESLRKTWLADERIARNLLSDDSRCSIRDTEAIIYLVPSEIEILLRAINGKRMSAWESLGRPASDDLALPTDPAALAATRLMSAANAMIHSLLKIVGE